MQRAAALVENFILKMDMAAEEDVNANLVKQPAVQKLKMLNEVDTELRKKHVQHAFIENSGLASLAKWLKPLPDGSIPNVKVRQTLLEILELFKDIDVDYLKESGIGKSVMILSKHPMETVGNKKIAATLIERWSRPIFGISSEYKDLREYDDQDTTQQKKKEVEKVITPKRDSMKSSVDLEHELTKKYQKSDGANRSFHARIPDRVSFDFKRRPKSAVNVDAEAKGPGSQAKQKKFDKLLQKTRSGGGLKNSRAAPMSIEGRNLFI